MDLTPEDIKILYLAAEAFVGAGDPITIGGDIEANLPVILGLIAADPRFRAGALAAYRAGREDAAKALEDFRLGSDLAGEIFLEHAVKSCHFWEVQVGGSDDGSPRMELDSVLESAREHIRTRHNTERGSE